MCIKTDGHLVHNKEFLTLARNYIPLDIKIMSTEKEANPNFFGTDGSETELHNFFGGTEPLRSENPSFTPLRTNCVRK